MFFVYTDTLYYLLFELSYQQRRHPLFSITPLKSLKTNLFIFKKLPRLVYIIDLFSIDLIYFNFNILSIFFSFFLFLYFSFYIMFTEIKVVFISFSIPYFSAKKKNRYDLFYQAHSTPY